MSLRLAAAAALLSASLGAAGARSPDSVPDVRVAQATPNIAPTGKMMPPTTGREPGGSLRSSTESDMLKAQKATEERNKAWDSKMRRTMGTICNGC